MAAHIQQLSFEIPAVKTRLQGMAGCFRPFRAGRVSGRRVDLISLGAQDRLAVYPDFFWRDELRKDKHA